MPFWDIDCSRIKTWQFSLVFPAKVDHVLHVELGGADGVIAQALHDPHLGPFHRETVRLVSSIELTARKSKTFVSVEVWTTCLQIYLSTLNLLYDILSITGKDRSSLYISTDFYRYQNHLIYVSSVLFGIRGIRLFFLFLKRSRIKLKQELDKNSVYSYIFNVWHWNNNNFQQYITPRQKSVWKLLYKVP